MVTDRRLYATSAIPRRWTILLPALPRVAERAARAGVDLVQIRERSLEAASLLALAAACASDRRNRRAHGRQRARRCRAGGRR